MGNVISGEEEEDDLELDEIEAPEPANEGNEEPTDPDKVEVVVSDGIGGMVTSMLNAPAALGSMLDLSVLKTEAEEPDEEEKSSSLVSTQILRRTSDTTYGPAMQPKSGAVPVGIEITSKGKSTVVYNFAPSNLQKVPETDLNTMYTRYFQKVIQPQDESRQMPEHVALALDEEAQERRAAEIAADERKEKATREKEAQYLKEVLQELFEWLDTKGTGYLDERGLQVGLKMLGLGYKVEYMMSMIDVDNGGKVTLHELAAFATGLRLNPVAPMDTLRKVYTGYKEFDDGDGMLSMAEIRALMQYVDINWTVDTINDYLPMTMADMDLIELFNVVLEKELTDFSGFRVPIRFEIPLRLRWYVDRAKEDTNPNDERGYIHLYFESMPGVFEDRGREEDNGEKWPWGILTLKKAFENVDDDNSGVISALEFRQLLQKFGVELSATQSFELFSLMDSDDGGTVSFLEFISGLALNVFQGTLIEDTITVDNIATISSFLKLADGDELLNIMARAPAPRRPRAPDTTSMPFLERKAAGLIIDIGKKKQAKYEAQRGKHAKDYIRRELGVVVKSKSKGNPHEKAAEEIENDQQFKMAVVQMDIYSTCKSRLIEEIEFWELRSALQRGMKNGLVTFSFDDFFEAVSKVVKRDNFYEWFAHVFDIARALVRQQVKTVSFLELISRMIDTVGSDHTVMDVMQIFKLMDTSQTGLLRSEDINIIFSAINLSSAERHGALERIMRGRNTINWVNFTQAFRQEEDSVRSAYMADMFDLLDYGDTASLDFPAFVVLMKCLGQPYNHFSLQKSLQVVRLSPQKSLQVVDIDDSGLLKKGFLKGLLKGKNMVMLPIDLLWGVKDIFLNLDMRKQGRIKTLDLVYVLAVLADDWNWEGQDVMRLLARSAAKNLAPVAAMPIIALWNLLLARRVMREVRTITVGQFAVIDILHMLLIDDYRSRLALMENEVQQSMSVDEVVREALELGHPSDEKYGIDPLRNLNTFARDFIQLLSMFKGGMTKFICKTVFKAPSGVLPVAHDDIDDDGDEDDAMEGGEGDDALIEEEENDSGDDEEVKSPGDQDDDMDDDEEMEYVIPVKEDAAEREAREMQRQQKLFEDAEERMPRLCSMWMRSGHQLHGLPLNTRKLCINAVACAIVHKTFWHPNLELVLKELIVNFKVSMDEIAHLGDIGVFLAPPTPDNECHISRLDTPCKYLVLRVFALCLMVDSDLDATEIQILQRALKTCKFQVRFRSFQKLHMKLSKLAHSAADFLVLFEGFHEIPDENLVKDEQMTIKDHIVETIKSITNVISL
eukprot:gene9746-11549_t